MRSSGDRFRLMAQSRNTVVRATFYDDNGNAIHQKEVELSWAKQSVDVFAPDGVSINTPVKWESDKPFSITQLRLTNGTYSDPDNSPAMVRVVPTSLYSSRSTFALPAVLENEPFSTFDLQLIGHGKRRESL